MRSITRLTLLSASLLFTATTLVRAADPTPAEPAASQAPATASEPAAPKKKHPATELEDRMGEMSSAFKKLRRQIPDASKNASSLELVGKIRAGTEQAIKLTPARAADVPAAERPKFIADYQDGIKHLQASLGKLEEALKANDNTEAAKILKEIGGEQKEGHKQFMRPE
jgi:Cytochrome b562